MKYKIADFLIEVTDTKYKRMDYVAKDYIVETGEPDVVLSVEKADIEEEERLSEENFREGVLYVTAAHRKIADWLPNRDAFLMHSALFDVDGTGVAFAAHSGTGKTTHMLLWQKLLGERMTIVNGDKPIIRFFDGEEFPFAYGTPWNGKECFGCDMKTRLEHICFIERSKTNYVEKLEKGDVIDRIFKQVYMSKDPIAVMKTMELVDRMLGTCNLWLIHCNMEDDAAKVSYNAIFGSEK